MCEQGAIERSALVLASPAQRPDVTVARIDSNHCTLYQSATAGLRLNCGSLPSNRAVSRELSAAIQRRQNSEINNVGSAALNDRIDELAHRVQRVRIVGILRPPLFARDS